MSKPDLTRERILDAVLNQVSLRGIAGLSIADLAGAAGVSKSGFYANFGSRNGLYESVVGAIVERFVREVWSPHAEDDPGVERLLAVVARWRRWVEGDVLPGGCPISVVAAELVGEGGPASDHLKTAQRKWIRLLAREFAATGGRLNIQREDEQAAFELYGLMMGYAFQKRFLSDIEAGMKFDVALNLLLGRTRKTRA